MEIDSKIRELIRRGVISAFPILFAAGCGPCPRQHLVHPITNAEYLEIRYASRRETQLSCEAACERQYGSTPRDCRFGLIADDFPNPDQTLHERSDNGPPPAEPVVICAYIYCGPAGRRPADLASPRVYGRSSVGQYLARQAYLEAASVPAFIRLARELNAHRAPRSLAHAALTAAMDEVRHAQSMSRASGAEGAAFEAPNPVPLSVRPFEDVMRENVVEGCVLETHAATVARYQASRAERALRPVLAEIAREEASHATLARRIYSWAQSRLSSRLRRRLRDAWQHEAERLIERSAEPRLALKARLGLPSATRSADLASELLFS